MSGIHPVVRGRGRPVIVPDEILNAPLRRPGEVENSEHLPHEVNATNYFNYSSSFSLATSPSTTKLLSQMLSKLDLLFSGEIEDLMVYRVLSIYVFKESDSISHYEAMMEFIFRNALQDPSNVVAICKYIYLFTRHPEKGIQIRNCFYKCLQQNFNEREEIKVTHGLNGYKNFIKMFLAAAHHVRHIFYTPFLDIIKGLIDIANSFCQQLQSPEDIKLYCLLANVWCICKDITKLELYPECWLDDLILEKKNPFKKNLIQNVNVLDFSNRFTNQLLPAKRKTIK